MVSAARAGTQGGTDWSHQLGNKMSKARLTPSGGLFVVGSKSSWVSTMIAKVVSPGYISVKLVIPMQFCLTHLGYPPAVHPTPQDVSRTPATSDSTHPPLVLQSAFPPISLTSLLVGHLRRLPMMRLRELVHPKIPQIDDEALERQARVDGLDDHRHPPRIALLHLLPDERGDFCNILAHLWVSGLVDRYAMSAPPGEGGGRVDLADAEDGVDDDFD